ncbi:hypothetical protein Q7P37_003768 [Cladosporium fusiforme]
MLAQSFLASALLACGALAAPTSSLAAAVDAPSTANAVEKRADWQEGKCQAHINVHIPKLHFFGHDLYWTVDMIDTAGTQIGHWEAKNALEKDRTISTIKDHEFYIRGQPDTNESADHLTLYYGSQIWNSKDCYRYERKEETLSYYHDYYCQFDC